MSHHTFPSIPSISSMPTIASRTSSIDYISDYDIAMSMDTSCKNKLINIENDADELFMIKNDFYMNYGIEKYTYLLKIYNEKINQINFNDFNEKLWKKSFELYEARDEIIKKSYFCFPKKSEKIDINMIKNTFIFLNKMYMKNEKIKILKETIEFVKYLRI